MDDDFNTGGAIGDLFELVRALNKFVDDEKLEGAGRENRAALDALRRGAAALRELAATLGLFRAAVESPAAGGDELAGKLMKLLIDTARRGPQEEGLRHGRPDSQPLTEIGITLEDRPGGTEWSRS